MDKTFEELIRAIGAELDPEGRYAIISNAYGEFRAYLKTGTVVYRPMICNYCENPCDLVKEMCIVSRSKGWSNISLDQRKLLVLAKLYSIKLEQFDVIMERQMINHCYKDLRRHCASTFRIMPKEYFEEKQEQLCERFGRLRGLRLPRRRDIQQIYAEMAFLPSLLSGTSNLLRSRNPPEAMTRELEADIEYATIINQVVCADLHIPVNVQRRVAQICQRIIKERIVPRKFLESFVNAAILIACQENQVPFQMGDLVQGKVLPFERHIRRFYEAIKRILHGL